MGLGMTSSASIPELVNKAITYLRVYENHANVHKLPTVLVKGAETSPLIAKMAPLMHSQANLTRALAVLRNAPFRLKLAQQ